MTETAQGTSPAESEVASEADPVAEAASAFKLALGQSRLSERMSDDEPREDEIPDPRPSPGQAVRDDGEGEASAEESDEAPAGEADEAGEGEEPGPQPLPLPASWPDDKAELWAGLPPEAQAFIAARDGQMNAALNARFQEAANLRKVHAAEIGEAQASRARYAEAVDQVLSLVVPQRPPRSMLDVNSSDYDPDAYHYRKAVHEDTVAFLDSHAAQRREIAAQEQSQRFEAINGATRDAFIGAVPEVADQAKAPAVFQELMDYAVALGTPADIFQTPTTALEWHVLWKAREYDRLQSAKARISGSARPEPRKAQPPVRPGVTTPKSAIEQTRFKGAMERLRNEGSVEAGAAALKHLMKGKLS